MRHHCHDTRQPIAARKRETKRADFPGSGNCQRSPVRGRHGQESDRPRFKVHSVSVSCQSEMFSLSVFAGTPPINDLDGNSPPATTEFAPTMLSRPITVPLRTATPAPIHTCGPIDVGRAGSAPVRSCQSQSVTNVFQLIAQSGPMVTSRATATTLRAPSAESLWCWAPPMSSLPLLRRSMTTSEAMENVPSSVKLDPDASLMAGGVLAETGRIRRSCPPASHLAPHSLWILRRMTSRSKATAGNTLQEST